MKIQLILSLIAISVLTVINSAPITRVQAVNTKAIYTDNLYAIFSQYFKSLETISKSYFNLPKATFNNAATDEKFEFTENFYSLDSIQTPKEREAEIYLSEDCSVKYKATTPIIFTYLNKNAQYTKGKDKPIAVSFSELKFVLNDFELSRKPSTTGSVFEYKFEIFVPELTLKFIGSASQQSEAFFNIKEMKEALISKLDNIITSNIEHQIVVLNLTNSNDLNLNASNLPDGKPAYLKTKLSELHSCKDDFIVEKFSGSITESYIASKSLSYTFDTQKSDSQVIYDHNLLFDELIQSRVLNNRFTFTVSKTNAKDYSPIEFKIDVLASIFPYIRSKYVSSDEFLADCLVTKASSKPVTPTNESTIPSVTVAEIKCDLKDLSVDPKIQVIETIYAEYVMSLEYKINESNQFVANLAKIELYDDGITSLNIYNFEALTKVLVKTMDSYFKKNPIELFKLDNNKEKTGKFEVLPEGILYYVAKAQSDKSEQEKLFLGN